MIRDERFAWANGATEATVAVGEDPPPTAEQLLSRLGRVEAYGRLPFVQAFELQGSLYDDDTFDRRAVFQVERSPGTDGPWWATVEPNGLEVDAVPKERQDLPFGDAPRSAAMGLLERWTGVAIAEHWSMAPKPTFIVETPIR